jgi:hypothetical protein
MWAAEHGHSEVARLLLDRAADPNQARTDDGATALMFAACYGRLEVAQLLLLFGADPEVQDVDGETAQAIALDDGQPGVAACLGAVAGWPAFKIAVACRLHADARRMLHRGTVDPSDCSLAELLVVGGTPANTLWPGSPGPCDATAALARAAMSSWSPGRHSLHHLGVRSGVLTTLLVARRLRGRAAVGGAVVPQNQRRVLQRCTAVFGADDLAAQRAVARDVQLLVPQRLCLNPVLNQNHRTCGRGVGLEDPAASSPSSSSRYSTVL